MAVAFGRCAVYNWRASPTTCTCPAAILRIVTAHRLCCQLFQNPVHRPADSRPVLIRVFRPVGVLSRPSHINQIQTVYNVGFVAFPVAGVVPHHRILCEIMMYLKIPKNNTPTANLMLTLGLVEDVQVAPFETMCSSATMPVVE